MNIKKGFTLGETLITLAIMGVIVAIAMPGLNNLRPNQEMVMLKKVYYETGRLINELVNDDDYYPDGDDEEHSGFSHTINDPAPEARYRGREYSGDTKFCWLFALRMNVRGGINCDTEGITSENTFKRGATPGEGHFTTTDGVVWVLPIGSFANDRESIFIDVNGNRPDNCFPGEEKCKKPDRFEIQLDRLGRLYIEDELTRRYLSRTDVTKQFDDVNANRGN